MTKGLPRDPADCFSSPLVLGFRRPARAPLVSYSSASLFSSCSTLLVS